jgi:hypothetical protein
MSDILIHSAIVENQKYLRSWVLKQLNPGAVDSVDYYACNCHTGEPYKGAITTGFVPTNVTVCPQIVKDWKKYLSPVVKTHTNGFKVCDTSGYWRCGTNCTWCVPPGVTSVQFQLWGPGGGNSGQCCCGGTPFGPSGSYMVSTLNVTPGECYCLCAGCAYCCYANQTTASGQGSPTWISNSATGYCVCAEGACTCMCCWNAAVGSNPSCGISVPSSSTRGYGPSQCSGWNFCWDENADTTAVPSFFGAETWRTPNPLNSVNYGLPVVYPGIVIGCDLSSAGAQQSWTITAPVFGFENCTCCLTAYVLNQIGSLCDGNGGCHRSAQNGYQQIPAVGGYGGWVCGGNSPGCGDPGGMGMICVSWNCA